MKYNTISSGNVAGDRKKAAELARVNKVGYTSLSKVPPIFLIWNSNASVEGNILRMPLVRETIPCTKNAVPKGVPLTTILCIWNSNAAVAFECKTVAR